MKKFMTIVVLSFAVLLSGCKEAVSTTEHYETATVTKFNKRYKHQRISFKTESSVYDDFYLTKRCSCNAKVGDKIKIRHVRTKWDDGTETTYVDQYYIRNQLRN